MGHPRGAGTPSPTHGAVRPPDLQARGAGRSFLKIGVPRNPSPLTQGGQTPCPTPRGFRTLRFTSPGRGGGTHSLGLLDPQSPHLRTARFPGSGDSGPPDFQVKTLLAPHRASAEPPLSPWSGPPQHPSPQLGPSVSVGVLAPPGPTAQGQPQNPQDTPGCCRTPVPPTWGSSPPGSPALVPSPTFEGLRSLLRGFRVTIPGLQDPQNGGLSPTDSPGCPPCPQQPLQQQLRSRQHPRTAPQSLP